MKKDNLIDIIEKNGFKECNYLYEKLKENEINIIDKEIYIFNDDKRIIVLKPYETFKAAYFSYEDTQNKIKAILQLSHKKYRKNLYYFLCINQKLESKYIKIINLIEKNKYVCKKYVISNDEDFKRITFFNSDNIDSQYLNYNNIKVNELFIKLIDRYCENKNSIKYAQEYIEENKINLKDGE